ncbi:MAG: hypothetical protein APF76_18190 [Desulfitibacter sp. BRH_c19]|nr:MAG: hypothetical protein APF76_18190 [Desulfitibacter sp. BRH_c19]
MNATNERTIFDIKLDNGIDILIKNGCIIDGTGNPSYHADISIIKDKIVLVTKDSHYINAARVIDATDKIVCPGFIDAHSHTDSTIFLNPTAESTVRQGITTEIVGHCGMSVAPITEEAKSKGSGGFGSFKGVDIPPCSFGQFLELMEKMGTSINIAWLLGHNTVRSVAGVSGSTVSLEQYKKMEVVVQEAMEAGAIGFSTGLEFEPGRSATMEEIIRLTKVMGKYGGIYTSHIRNRDFLIQDAIEEFIEVVRGCDVKGQVSHLNIRHNTGAPEGAWQKAVMTIEAARAEGLDILTDFTPLRYGIGQMSAILPKWLRKNGTLEASKMLLDHSVRSRLRADCDRYWRFIHRGEWDRVRMQSNPAYPELNGKTFIQISQNWNRDPWDCYFDILAAAGSEMDSIVLVALLFTEEHCREGISHPLFMLNVDGYSTRIDGPLAEQTRYPLHYMGMVHFLTYHVREKKTLRLEEAIRKMTSMPANPGY